MAVVAVLGIGVAVVAALGLRDARRARNDLEAARSALAGVSGRPESLSSADGRASAQASLRAAAVSIADGRQTLHSSVALAAARFVPGLRGQRQDLFRLVDDAQLAVADGTSLLGDVSASADALHVRKGTIPLDPVSRLGASAHRYGTQLGGLVRPAAGMWGPLRTAREQFNRLDDSIAQRLITGGDGLGASTTFLGTHGPRRYFLALQNNAEMRDQGMVLSYGIVTATGGHVSVEKTGRIDDLLFQGKTITPVPPGTAKVFAEIPPTQMWRSSNAPADFRFSGRVMVDMYRQATGQPIDGVIAIDVPGLAGLLEVTGPVTVPGIPVPISASNAGQVLLHDLYQGHTADDRTQRIEHLAEVAAAVVGRLSSGEFDAIGLARHLGTAAAGGHVKLFSTDASEQTAFEHAGIAGGPAVTLADRTFHVAVESRLGSKVDYYIHPVVTQAVTLERDGAARVHTTVTVENQAPSGPPSEQLGPDTVNHTGAGDYVAWILLWAPAGSVQVGGIPESGLEVTQQVPLIHPGQTVAVSFDTVIPNAVRGGQLQLRYFPQPRLTPDDLTVTVTAPGWKVDGPATFHAAMDRTLTPTWKVRR